MEFDRDNILTVVTADQAKVGQKGWFANDLETLEKKVTCDNPDKLDEVLNKTNNLRFKKETHTLWALFYPAPEPTIPIFKVGDRVVVQKGGLSTEEEIATVVDPCGKDDFMFVDNNKIRCGLKKHLCKLLTYRPFKNAEEFKPFRDEWFATTFPNGEQSHFKVIDYCDTGIVSVGGYSTDSRAKLSFCTYAGMFKWVTRENGEPCGIREAD